MAPGQSTLRNATGDVVSPGGTLRSPGGTSIHDKILGRAAAMSRVQVRVLSPLSRTSPSKRTAKHKRVTPSVAMTLRFNEEASEPTITTQTESPETHPVNTQEDQSSLTVMNEVDIVVNASLPWFKRLHPRRAAQAAIRVAKLSQKNAGRGNRTKEDVVGHMRQQLGFANQIAKGTARPGTELLSMNEGVNLFAYKKDDTMEPLDCKDGGSSNLYCALSNLKRAMKPCGSEEHKCYLLHQYLTKDENQNIARTLGVLKCPEKDHGTADSVADNLKSYFSETKGKSSNDIIGARNTVLFALATPAPSATATASEKKAYATSLKNLTDRLGLSEAMQKSAKQMGKLRGEMIRDESEMKEKSNYVQAYSRVNKYRARKLTPELREAFKVWLFTMCPLISASPCKKAVKKVKDEDTGETIELRKYHYTFSKRRVQFCHTSPNQRWVSWIPSSG